MGAPPTTRPPSCRGGAPPAPARPALETTGRPTQRTAAPPKPARETESWRRWPRLELQNPERQATRQDPDPGRITGAAWHGTIDQDYEDPGEPADPSPHDNPPGLNQRRGKAAVQGLHPPLPHPIRPPDTPI